MGWILPVLAMIAGQGGEAVNVSCTVAPDLVAVERARSAAIAGHDAAFLDRLYSPDFDGSMRPGMRIDKAALLTLFARNDGSTAFEIDQLEPFAAGDGLAGIRGRLTGRRDGAVVQQSRFVHLYRRYDCEWRVIYGASAPEPRA